MIKMIIRNDDFTYEVAGEYRSIQFAYEAITIAGIRDEDITIEADGKTYTTAEAFNSENPAFAGL